jgi:hypothetical protein
VAKKGPRILNVGLLKKKKMRLQEILAKIMKTFTFSLVGAQVLQLPIIPWIL